MAECWCRAGLQSGHYVAVAGNYREPHPVGPAGRTCSQLLGPARRGGRSSALGSGCQVCVCRLSSSRSVRVCSSLPEARVAALGGVSLARAGRWARGSAARRSEVDHSKATSLEECRRRRPRHFHTRSRLSAEWARGSRSGLGQFVYANA